MTKKKGEAKKKSSRKKTTRKRAVRHKTEHHHVEAKHPSEVHVEKVLVENFVALQKVMTNLSVKFDSLSTQISKLLELFEISAKTMAQKSFEFGGKKDEEMLKKIDNLLEQNKVIARGLTLLHEPEGPPLPPSPPQSLPTRPQVPQIPRQVPQTSISPMPGTRTPMPTPPSIKQNAVEENPSNINMADYQKSQHIDESQNLNFDLSRNNKEKKDESLI